MSESQKIANSLFFASESHFLKFNRAIFSKKPMREFPTLVINRQKISRHCSGKRSLLGEKQVIARKYRKGLSLCALQVRVIILLFSNDMSTFCEKKQRHVHKYFAEVKREFLKKLTEFIINYFKRIDCSIFLPSLYAALYVKDQ